MLFLKRLENDGETVEISKKDRDLLKNYGKAEEEKADKDLDAAVAIDIEQTRKDIEDNMLQEADKEDERNKKDVMGPKQRNPESMIEKLRVKRMKSHCASTNAVSRKMNSKNAYQLDKIKKQGMQRVKRSTSKAAAGARINLLNRNFVTVKSGSKSNLNFQEQVKLENRSNNADKVKHQKEYSKKRADKYMNISGDQDDRSQIRPVSVINYGENQDSLSGT